MQLNCCSTALVTREQALTPTAGIATTQHAKKEAYKHVLLHLLLIDSLSSASARADPGYQVTAYMYVGVHLTCLGCQEASWQVSKLTCTDQQQYSHIQV